MKLTKEVLAALNSQINKEFYAAYLYLAMAAFLEERNLIGMAKWMQIQSEEEVMHAMKIYHFILERGNLPTLLSIDAPPTRWESAEDCFKKAYEHEKMVTASIQNLVKLTREENDQATEIFLQWYVTEQIEEENQTSTVLERVKLAGENGPGLFMLDTELGSRKVDNAPSGQA